jgi:hypothetical protein
LVQQNPGPGGGLTGGGDRRFFRGKIGADPIAPPG